MPAAPASRASPPASAADAAPPPSLAHLEQFVRDSLRTAMASTRDSPDDAQQPGGWPEWPTVPSDDGPEWQAPVPSQLPGQGKGHADHVRHSLSLSLVPSGWLGAATC